MRVTDDFIPRVRKDKGLHGTYSDQQPEVAAALQKHVSLGITTRSPEELSDSELAEALRPIAIVNGKAYLAVDIDVDSVRSARQLIGAGKSIKLAEGYSPSGSFDSFFGKACCGCCGTDDRWAAGANTNWPYATIIATMVPWNTANQDWDYNVKYRECTWQLIGHSTALAVAHCFYNTFTDTWNELTRWGAAPDAADNLTRPIPAGYPTQYYNYTRHVPLAWLSSNDDFNYDYAVIDFTGWTDPNPGYAAGWVGWGVLNSSDILNSKYQLWGVPKVDFNGNAKNPWPRIWGSTAVRYPSAVSTFAIDFPGDCSGGNSGSGLYQYVTAWNGWYVTGSESRYNSGMTACRARRLESNYLAFIQSSATEY